MAPRVVCQNEAPSQAVFNHTCGEPFSPDGQKTPLTYVPGRIERGREAQWRPCNLKADPLRDASGWIGQYRRFWEQSFDRLNAYLGGLQAKDARKGKKHVRKPKR